LGCLENHRNVIRPISAMSRIGHFRTDGRAAALALRLIYQVFTKLLGWFVLRTRSDTTRTSRSRSCAVGARNLAHGL